MTRAATAKKCTRPCHWGTGFLTSFRYVSLTIARGLEGMALPLAAKLSF